MRRVALHHHQSAAVGSARGLRRTGTSHAGHFHAGAWPRLLRGRHRLRLCLRTVVRGKAMIFDYSLAGLVSLGLLFYLTYALLRPERF